MLGYRLTHNGSPSGFIKDWIDRICTGVFGWDVVGQIPVADKFVLVGAPDTSNWDFPFTLAAVYIFRLRISWLGKDTLLKLPAARPVDETCRRAQVVSLKSSRYGECAR
jgi:1-acyl-sn-glycerol-3-phosphate acyltransferase